jgi:16S rRNA (guanine1207-N2)-methyltransferase
LINTNIKGIDLKFETIPGLFSPHSIDEGTLAMLSVVEFTPEDRVLDLGCGYGVVGILAARLIGGDRVTMVDIDERAVEYAHKNAALNNAAGIKLHRSNGFNDIEDSNFTKILSNPPYHEDFSVPKMFIEKGFNRLAIGGSLYMVTKREKWYRNKLTSIFGGVKVWRIGDYFVFMSVKKGINYANV